MHRILITIALAVPITSCASSKGNVYPLDPDYLRPSTFFVEIQKIATSYPELAKLHLIGLSSVA
ncbi:MAG: hypothetical protein PHI68_08710, partial [Candidatus Cloacimonetes bacterium]|nr:hypothetical protein [Candidatus Cloacimonadota bacterium]